MTPERWRRVTEIFHAALARTPAARAAFLDETCRDVALRADVEALLAAHEHASLDERLVGVGPLPHFDAGVSLGPYRIDALVGAGGMGEVYRATDLRLQRTIAIKVLQPGVSAHPGFDLRFEREAQLLASLNHPNIGAIHGFEDLDGIHALVLEFVEGSTLVERLESGKLPVDEALGIARQIAFGLEAAHEKNIVHRDLKPANIKITPDGVVKILDFGIAKGGGGASEAGASPPTLTGVVLGTPGYMSPEQARGRRVDKRTDIWAFGCVLFEMLTGRAPFDADTSSDVIARILEHDPPWHRLPADVPESIQKLLRRCLQKDPAERLHDIADARLEIADVMALPRRRRAGQPAGQRSKWLWLGIAVAAIVVAVIALQWVRSTSPGRTVELGVTFPENFVPSLGVAVSPDGLRVATGVVGSTRQIWMHSLETGETQPVVGTERGGNPIWSPDGTRLAFFQPGSLKSLNLAGGAVAEICKLKNVAGGGAWTSDGRIIFAQGGQLFVVRAAGGEPSPLGRTPVSGFAAFPQMLPDNRHVLFYTQERTDGWVAVAALDTGQTRRLVASSAAAVFAPPDHLLYVRGASVVAQKFDPVTLALDGEAQVVANAVGPGALATSDALGAISASPSGVLAFITERGGRPGQLTWFDRSGRAQSSIKPSAGGEYLNPAISPAGDAVAVNRMDPQTGNWDIWIVDAARGTATNLTSDNAIESDAVWSPDGKDVVFTSNIGGQLGLYRQSISTAGPAEPLYVAKGAGTLAASDWTPDLKSILFYQSGVDPWSIWVLPLSGDRKPTRLIGGYSPRLSPDGQWMAYRFFRGRDVPDLHPALSDAWLEAADLGKRRRAPAMDQPRPGDRLLGPSERPERRQHHSRRRGRADAIGRSGVRPWTH